MTGFADYSAKNTLNYITGQIQIALPAAYLALFTAAPTSDAGTGGTEVSGGTYARQQIAGSVATNGTTASGNATLHFASVPSWIVAGMSVHDSTAAVIPAGTTVLSTTGTTVVMSANATGGGVGSGDSIAFSAFTEATGSGPSQAVNGSVISFVATGASTAWGDVLAWGIYDASTSGNLLWWDFLGAFAWQPCTISSASPGVFTAHAHGFSVADLVEYTVEYGGTAPSFSQSNLTGVLAVAHAATDTFDVTNSATAVNTSATGNGQVRKLTKQTVPINTTFQISANNITLTLA